MTGPSTRRRLLRLLGAGGALGLAGCIAPTDDGSPDPSDGPTTDPSTDEFVVSEFDVSTTKVSPEKRYYLRVTAVYSTAAVEREEGDPTVLDVSEIEDPSVRSAVKDVLSEGEHWRDDVPGGLVDLSERVDFFTWEATTDPEDTATHWGVGVYRAHPERDPAVAFDAELVDDRVSEADPGAIDFSLTNTGERTQEVFSGTVPPFSVLRAEGPEQALLWRDYAEEGCVNFEKLGDESVMLVCDIGLTTPIEPGETIEKRYELRPSFEREAIRESGFDAPGQYSVAETLSYHGEGEEFAPSTKVDWTVSFRLDVA